MVDGVDLEALVLHGERIHRSPRLMVSTDTFLRRAVEDGGEVGQEVRAVGAQSTVGGEGAEARSVRGGRGW